LDDPRAYEKFALSLVNTGKYKIHLVGPPSTITPKNSEITFHVAGQGQRSGWQRLLLPLQIWRVIVKVKPQLLIVNTHDLLWVAVLNRILFGCRLIYDVQENYYRNLRYQHNYPWLLKQLLALYVRSKEYLTSPLVCGFVLAEKIYLKELNFLRDKAVVAENKYMPIIDAGRHKPLEPASIGFIYCGTVAKDYGVFTAIDFFLSIQPFLPGSNLSITGHCPNRSTAKRLQTLTKDIKSIHLNISEAPMPHLDILKEMQLADYLLLPYPPNKSTANCMPTKLYEALALKVPVIVAQNQLWSGVVESENAGLTVDYFARGLPYDAIARQLITTQHYIKTGRISPFWQSEEPKLLDLVSRMLKY
jgi:glycosyltransferase involved in cell wall biosynthesis